MEMGSNTSAKSFDPCQPAQSAQADMNRYFLPYVDFLRCQRNVIPFDSVGRKTKSALMIKSCFARAWIFRNIVNAHASLRMMYMFPVSSITVSVFATHIC